jgi:hypothetical protein
MVIEQADRFLADCVRAALTDQQAQAWPDAISSPDDCEVLASRASFHGIAVLLGHAPTVLANWPAAVADEVRREMRLAGLWEELHRSKIAGIIASLAQNGIDTILLKGTALAYLYYEEPATRRRGDTDLLIRPADLTRARSILAEAGCFRREDPHGLHSQETWLVDCGAGMEHSIDLHWEPSDRPVLQKILAADRLWQGRVQVARLSPHAGAPDPLMMLVHGAINQAWHLARGYSVEDERITGGRRLIWAVDYRKLTAGFDDNHWQALAAFCEQHDAAAIVHAALHGAQQDIGLAVPNEVMARLRAAAPASEAYAYIAEPGVVRDFWRDLRAVESVGSRLELMQAMAFAPRSHLLRKYPHCAHWPTGLLQLRRYSEALFRWRKTEPTS